MSNRHADEVFVAIHGRQKHFLGALETTPFQKLHIGDCVGNRRTGPQTDEDNVRNSAVPYIPGHVIDLVDACIDQSRIAIDARHIFARAC